MLYTSYFANLKNLPKDIVPISICGKAPDWYDGLQYKRLAPKYDFFKVWKETHDNDYYIKCFREQVLAWLDIKQVCYDLKRMAGTGNIALICYEKPGDFCHRHLVAEWFQAFGIPVEEWKGDSGESGS